MAALTFKVGGDTSGLGRAVSGAKGMLAGLGKAAKRLALGAAALGIAGFTAALAGLKAALDLGGRLSDVASNTGLLAGEALVLERAFQDAGIAGEKLQPTINKMQRSMVEAGEGLLTYKKAFDALGLSLEDLRSMGTAEQFKAIQAALAGVGDPAERAARAMQIFGRSGGDLGALFSNADAMGNASESVGAQAEILNKAAASFDRSSDLLSGIGTKLKGFFVGMADFINPVLLPILEEMNKLDLAKQGQAFGRSVALVAEAFGSGKIREMMSVSMLAAAKDFLNFLAKGFLGLGEAMATVFERIPKLVGAAMLMISDPEVWGHMERVFKGLAMVLAATLEEKLPRILGGTGVTEETDWAKRLGKTMMRTGSIQAMKSTESGKFMREMLDSGGGVMAEMLKRVQAVADGRGLDIFNSDEERGWLARQKIKLEEELDEKKKREEAARGKGKGQGDADEEELGIGAGMASVMKAAVSSMGRVGGTGGRGRIATMMDRERNGLLKKIAENTGAETVARYA